jgi:uncharacterized membrane protein YkoI
MRNVVAVVWLVGLAAAQEDAGWAQRVEEAKLRLHEAVDRGVQEVPDGVPFHAELEVDKGLLVWSIDLALGTKTVNIVLDSKDGKVLERETDEDEDHSKAIALSRVALKAAIELALRRCPGAAVEARLVTINDRNPKFLVKIAAGDEAVTVSVNAVTGEAGVVRGGPMPSRAVQPFTDTFRVEAVDWSPTGANPYFILEPGHVLVLERGQEKLTITVLDETRVVDGVTTRVVEEREEKEGKLVEISRNFFAMSKRTNDVYYFGEEVDIYEDGKVVSHEGAWLAGEKGARFGLIMPGTPLNGARYRLEIAPGVAMDQAEIVGATETVETPAGKFEGCLKIQESSAMKGGHEYKYYAPGIGLVLDGGLRLARHGRAK